MTRKPPAIAAFIAGSTASGSAVRRIADARCAPANVTNSSGVIGASPGDQYDFAHTTRFALGLPVNGQVPGPLPGSSSGMQRTVTERSRAT